MFEVKRIKSKNAILIEIKISITPGLTNVLIHPSTGSGRQRLMDGIMVIINVLREITLGFNLFKGLLHPFSNMSA
jgi:hypothetical protein